MDEVASAGEWRLVGDGRGVYEVRRDERVVERIVAGSAAGKDLPEDDVPIAQVATKADAEERFATLTERADGDDASKPDGAAASVESRSDGETGAGSDVPVDPLADAEELDRVLSDLPVGITLAVCLVGGLLAVWSAGFVVLSPAFLIGVGLLALAGMILVFVATRVASEGPAAARKLLWP